MMNRKQKEVKITEPTMDTMTAAVICPTLKVVSWTTETRVSA